MTEASSGERVEDPVLAALDELCDAVRQSMRDAELILVRADTIRTQRAEGMSYTAIVPMEARPLVVELLSDTMSRLAESGSRLRRAEARALHDEGVSMERIARLFGVTRQRVSSLLSASRERDSAPRSAGTDRTEAAG